MDSGALLLFHSPRACSLACLIALEAARIDHRLRIVDVRKGDNRRADYLAINPAGTVPALLIGEKLLTEAQAILTFIADRARPALLPAPGTLARARAHEWMNFLSSNVHPAFRMVFRPRYYGGRDAPIAAIGATGFARLVDLVPEIERRLGGFDFVLGDTPCVADFYLFVFYLWTFDERIAAPLPGRPAWHAHAERLFALPATRNALARSALDVSYAGLGA